MEKLKIVIAEADEALRAALHEAMSGEDDMAVAGATGDGREALRLVGVTMPDVLVMDMLLTHMDGLELLDHRPGSGGPTSCSSPPW